MTFFCYKELLTVMECAVQADFISPFIPDKKFLRLFPASRRQQGVTDGHARGDKHGLIADINLQG